MKQIPQPSRLFSAWLGRRRDASACAPIGVDFAAHGLNMLQLEAGPDGPLLRAAVSRPYPVERAALLANPRALRAFVDQALASAPFAGRRVVAALAPGDVRILPLTIQVAGGQGEAAAVARAAREQLGDGAAEHVIDYYHVRTADAGPEKQVLVAAAPHDKVVGYLDSLCGAGLDPVALDIGPAAIARLLAAMHQDDYEQSVLLINFGQARSYLTVIWGRRLMLDREIEFGEEQLVGKLAQALALPPEVALALLREHGVGGGGQDGASDVGRTIREILYPEFAALAEELVRTQIYVASRTRGSTLSRVYLNGSAARYADIQSRIGALVNLPVGILDPLAAFGQAPGFAAGPELSRGIALAAGLALREEDNG
ncbi:pilus assembly protein PilM [Massilia sp. G4R7]|uniref:Pilus assembly protein PilM n=1 Tax=Massilia phyllostachyos TaxID=2898585 RepID=A0ABS8QBM5_9BURK|nr:pilus assembly protein PilM [Massilia phyllostachyos]MCD2519147.1 pilus assembly protein PilM [Massilia phyllostachyos]